MQDALLKVFLKNSFALCTSVEIGVKEEKLFGFWGGASWDPQATLYFRRQSSSWTSWKVDK